MLREKEAKGPLADARYLSQQSAGGATFAEKSSAAFAGGATFEEKSSAERALWAAFRVDNSDERYADDRAKSLRNDYFRAESRAFGSYAIGTVGSVNQAQDLPDHEKVRQATSSRFSPRTLPMSIPATFKHQSTRGMASSLENAAALAPNLRGSCDSSRSTSQYAPEGLSTKRARASHNWQALLSQECTSMQAILNEENEALLAQVTVQAVMGLGQALRAYSSRIEGMRDEKKRLVKMAATMSRLGNTRPARENRSTMKATKSAPAVSSAPVSGWASWKRSETFAKQNSVTTADADVQTDPLPETNLLPSGLAPHSSPSRSQTRDSAQLSTVEEGNPSLYTSGAGSERNLYLSEVSEADNASCGSLGLGSEPGHLDARGLEPEGLEPGSNAQLPQPFRGSAPGRLDAGGLEPEGLEPGSNAKLESNGPSESAVKSPGGSERERVEFVKQDTFVSDWATDSVDEGADRDSCQAMAPRATACVRASGERHSPRFSGRSCWSVRFGKSASEENRLSQDSRISAGWADYVDIDEEGNGEPIRASSSDYPMDHMTTIGHTLTNRSQSVPPAPRKSTLPRPKSITTAGATSTFRAAGGSDSSAVTTLMGAAQRARESCEAPPERQPFASEGRHSWSSDRTGRSIAVEDPDMKEVQKLGSGVSIKSRMSRASNWDSQREDDFTQAYTSPADSNEKRLTKRRTNVLDQIKGVDESARMSMPGGQLPRASSINLRSKSGTFGAYEIKLKPAWVQDTQEFDHSTYGGDKSIRAALLGMIDNSEEITYDLESRLQPYVLLPYCKKRFFWMLPGAMLIIYDLVYIPLQVFEEPSSRFTQAMAWIASFYWLCDMPVSFFTGVYRSREGRIEMRLVPIAKLYCSTWFPIDLACLVPDWVGIILEGSPEGSHGDSVTLTRLSKTLRIIRILRSVRLLRLAKLQHFAKDIKDRINSEYVFSFVQVCVLMLILVCVSHFLACAWYGIGQHGDKGWVHEHVKYDPDGSTHNMYMTALHWSLAQFQGNMEVHPVIFEERVFATVVLIVGLVGISSLLSSITNMMMELQNYKRESTTQWWTLCRYLREQHVTMTTVMRVKRFMKHVMSGNHVKRADVFLLDKLPDHLQMEIDFDVYGPTLEAHRFFSHYGEESPRCMKLICHALEMEVVGQGDTIFGEGEAAVHMYWVKTGKLLYTQAGGAGEEHVLNNASWISEPVLWVPWVHVGELFSYSASELLTLSSDAFEEITMSQINAILFATEYAQQFMSKLTELNQYHLTDVMQVRVEPISLLTPMIAKRRFKSSYLIEQKTKSHLFGSTLFLRSPLEDDKLTLCGCLQSLCGRKTNADPK